MIESLPGLLFHLDQHLAAVVHSYGFWTYLLLFAIIFFETGLVIAPFLPGNPPALCRRCGRGQRHLKPQPPDRSFYPRGCLRGHGQLLAGQLYRSAYLQGAVPELCKKRVSRQDVTPFTRNTAVRPSLSPGSYRVVLSFAPFLAGVGTMGYHRFLFYNVLGAAAWTLAVVLSGDYLGRLPIVRENMNLLLLLVLVVTAGTILLLLAGLIGSVWQKKKEEGRQ